MQPHFQIHKQRQRHAENHEVGNQIRDARAQPAGALVLAYSVGGGHPRRCQRRAFFEVVCDGAEQEREYEERGDDLDRAAAAVAGVGDEDVAVQDDEGEFQQAEGGGPGEFFDEEGLGWEKLDGKQGC